MPLLISQDWPRAQFILSTEDLLSELLCRMFGFYSFRRGSTLRVIRVPMLISQDWPGAQFTLSTEVLLSELITTAPVASYGRETCVKTFMFM